MQSQTTSQSVRTIKEARAELREWGRFWQRQQGSVGSLFDAMLANSMTKKHRRNISRDGDYRNPLRGAEVQVHASCSPSRIIKVGTSDDIFVPWHLQSLNDFIESLDSQLRIPLRTFYISGLKEEAKGFWLDRAENMVMLR